MSIKSEDLTLWDRNHIRHNAIHLLVNTKISSRFEALSEATLTCLYSKGYSIVPYPKMLIIQVSEYLRLREKHNMSSDDIINMIFECLESNKLEIQKDQNRESTWPKPSPMWYTEEITYKKPWVY